jgi:hypothetical protein
VEEIRFAVATGSLLAVSPTQEYLREVSHSHPASSDLLVREGDTYNAIQMGTHMLLVVH